MSIHLILEIIVLLAAIFIGIRLGGIAIGYAGGLGVVVLSLGLGLHPGKIPWDVILIIMSVICAISAMQVAGGMDFLVSVAEKILHKNPKQINFLAPTITFFLTVFAGTGHTAFSMIPVIVEVAKGENIKPSVPLSISVVASQIAITASPISAAVVYLTGALEPFGVGYLTLLAIFIPTAYVGCMITAFIMSKISKLDLSSDEVYKERLAKGLVAAPKPHSERNLAKGAKTSVLIFGICVLAVVCYAAIISPSLGIMTKAEVIMPRNDAIMSFMLAAATFICIICKIDTGEVQNSGTFKSGMIACACVLGVAWLGNTFVSAHIDGIKSFAGGLVNDYPYLVAVGLFFASMLLYSQAATAKALIPTVIIALGITAADTHNVYIIVASFAAVSALFVLPTYPTLLGAVQMDDTGTTRIGKFVFNHSFLVPGVLAIVITVALGFVVAPMLL